MFNPISKILIATSNNENKLCVVSANGATRIDTLPSVEPPEEPFTVTIHEEFIPSQSSIGGLYPYEGYTFNPLKDTIAVYSATNERQAPVYPLESIILNYSSTEPGTVYFGSQTDSIVKIQFATVNVPNVTLTSVWDATTGEKLQAFTAALDPNDPTTLSYYLLSSKISGWKTKLNLGTHGYTLTEPKVIVGYLSNKGVYSDSITVNANQPYQLFDIGGRYLTDSSWLALTAKKYYHNGTWNDFPTSGMIFTITRLSGSNNLQFTSNTTSWELSGVIVNKGGKTK